MCRGPLLIPGKKVFLSFYTSGFASDDIFGILLTRQGFSGKHYQTEGLG